MLAHSTQCSLHTSMHRTREPQAHWRHARSLFRPLLWANSDGARPASLFEDHACGSHSVSKPGCTTMVWAFTLMWSHKCGPFIFQRSWIYSIRVCGVPKETLIAFVNGNGEQHNKTVSHFWTRTLLPPGVEALRVETHCTGFYHFILKQCNEKTVGSPPWITCMHTSVHIALVLRHFHAADADIVFVFPCRGQRDFHHQMQPNKYRRKTNPPICLWEVCGNAAV